MGSRHFLYFLKSGIAHDEHNKNINKGLPCRKRIRIIQTVPDKIQHIGCKTKQKNSRQRKIAETLPCRNLSVYDIHGNQHHHRSAAVNVRPVIQPPFTGNAHAVSCQHIQHRKVGFQLFGKIHISEIRLQNCKHLRHQQSGRHAACKKGIQDEIADNAEGAFFQKEQYQKVKHQENADHNRYIIITENGKPQCNAIQAAAPFLY